MLGRTFAILGLLAILLAPFGVIKTHGPAEIEAAAAHAVHGHSHGLDMKQSAAAGYKHDASDHEHQLHAVLMRKNSESFDLDDLSFRLLMEAGSALYPDGLKRPPKQFSA